MPGEMEMLNIRIERARGPATVLLVAGLAVVLPGCGLEVTNPGAIPDEELNNPDLLDVVVNGVSDEFNNVADAYAFTVARLTDEMAGTGSYFDTGRFRRGEFDDEDSSDPFYEQAQEAIWSAKEAWRRFENVLGDEAAGPLSAEVFTFEGLSHRFLGENFCEITYDVGPLEPRTAAFDRAIAAFETAVSHAGDDPAAADFKTASYAGLAQAYVGLGDWASAVAEAAKVPTDFEMVAHYHVQADQNVVFDETHDRAEIGVYGTLAAGLDPQDPRAPFTKCGEFVDPNDFEKGVNETGAGCTAHQGADGLTAHWRQEKYNEDGSDIPVAKGTEMRLIEAEAALRNGDLGTFTAKINEVRRFYGLDEIAQPSTAGALEYPNAMDDGWSILDAERWLTLWIEGRRLWDLYRWDH